MRERIEARGGSCGARTYRGWGKYTLFELQLVAKAIFKSLGVEKLN